MAHWPALLSRPVRTEINNRPSLTLFFLLVGTYLLTLVPHVEQLPPWISVSVVLALSVRVLLEFYRLPLPSTTFCGLLAIFLLIAVLFQFHTVLGRDAGTAFMAGLLAIKFFELRGPRDVALIIFSCFFVVMSALLYSQVVELFIYCLIMMWVLTALLLRTQMGDLPEDRLLRMLTLSAHIFLQALPLTIFLFFFFPRISRTFQLSFDESNIGITDRVEPGSIARLADDDSEAMRVTLTGTALPSTDTMYWRALVLWRYEAGAWTQGALAFQSENPPLPLHESDEVVQDITVWPHNKKWLFALDHPISQAINSAEPSPSTWAVFLKGNIVQLSYGSRTLDHKERYTVTSDVLLADEVLSKSEREISTQLPDKLNPQVQTLADQLYAQHPGDQQAYINAVFHYFRHGGFVYSSAPGREDPDWLPDFLFKSKTGFCEHYASAFAVLMRMEQIPARVVIGYHGGDYNPYRNFYIVRQSNAHAWDEVWSDAKKHWVRIDPTAVLSTGEDAPISPSAAQSNSADEGLSIQVAHHRFTFFSGAYLPGWMRRGLQEVELRRQQVEADWDDWVFAYDPETQTRLAQAMGFGRQTMATLFLACLVAAGICVIVFQKWLKRKPPVSPVEKLYAAFCRNMAQRGIPRATWEGPLAYTGRVAEAFPEKEEAIRSVGWIVARSRYGASPLGPAVPDELKSFLNLITASQAASSSRERN